MKNINKLLIFLLVLQLIGCKMKTYTLQNGITKVPVNPNVYKNKSNFDNSLLSVVDTTAIYEEYSIENKILCRLDDDAETRFYGVIRFYSNGCFNYFVIDRTKLIDSNSFNPSHKGYRGVFYKKENLTRYDLFAPGNELGWISKLPGTFIMNGDTLYDKSDLSGEGIFIKRELPLDYLKYNADW